MGVDRKGEQEASLSADGVATPDQSINKVSLSPPIALFIIHLILFCSVDRKAEAREQGTKRTREPR